MGKSKQIFLLERMYMQDFYNEEEKINKQFYDKRRSNSPNTIESHG